VTQLVLHLHECAVEHLQDASDPTAAEFAVKCPHSVADPATAGAAPTETSCLCVRV
jgi:hypothetical protein